MPNHEYLRITCECRGAMAWPLLQSIKTHDKAFEIRIWQLDAGIGIRANLESKCQLFSMGGK